MLFEHFGMSSEVLLHRDDVFSSGIAYSCVDVLNAQFPLHEVVLDSQRRVVAWYHPENNLDYDHFLNWAGISVETEC